ncbi:MAG: methylenetetrahydrofolate reductase [Actinomycetaceae bacterium]|nr:methylenetetrahydrofolate reductase [Actinomycetaceae bacterium]
MPPRRPNLAPKFWQTVDDFMTYRPDFVSVTYGAGGKDFSTSHETITRLVRETPVKPIAHLTCVGSPREELDQIIRDYLRVGVRTFLALRGDPPEDQPDWKPSAEHVSSAIELIHEIRRVEEEECRAAPSTRLRNAIRPLTIAVATFPNGNAAAGTTVDQEIQRLREKQDAGADFAITQLFWSADSYRTFLDLAERAGITIPIIPGILPGTSANRIRRTSELTGVPTPDELLTILDSAPNEEEAYRRGVEWGARLIIDVLDAGAPGVHLYSFNQSGPALDLLEAAGVSSWYKTDV